MFVSVVSSVSSSTPHRPDRTAEDGPGEVGELVHDAGVVTHSVESEGKQTGGFYAFIPVNRVIEGVCPADLCSDLSDVAIASETDRVRVARWSVGHVVLSSNPGQEAGQLRVDHRVVGVLSYVRIIEFVGIFEIKLRTSLKF